MKLNLGCGFNKLPGFVNVDKEELCLPDQRVDLERFPWPWPDDTFSEVMAFHSLEHLGETTESWIGILKELWRVCKPDAAIRIAVPHPFHDEFLADPTHVRIITPVGLAMFDQMRNISDFEAKGQETKLGLFTGIDFDLKTVEYDLDGHWRSQFASGQLNEQQIQAAMRFQNNVCNQIRMVVRVVKPQRGLEWIRGRGLSVSVRGSL